MARLLHPPTRIASCSSHAEPSRTHRRLRAALTALLGIVAVLLFLLVRSPGRTEQERRDDLARLTARLATEKQQVQQLRDLKQKVQAATNNEQDFAKENFLARNGAFSEMLIDLERLATENHVKPGDVTYALNEKDNKLGWINVDANLVVEGNYTDLVRFLNKLEQSKLFWIVESLGVSNRSNQQLRLNLRAATYLLPS